MELVEPPINRQTAPREAKGRLEAQLFTMFVHYERKSNVCVNLGIKGNFVNKPAIGSRSEWLSSCFSLQLPKIGINIFLVQRMNRRLQAEPVGQKSVWNGQLLNVDAKSGRCRRPFLARKREIVSPKCTVAFQFSACQTTRVHLADHRVQTSKLSWILIYKPMNAPRWAHFLSLYSALRSFGLQAP